MNIFICGDIMPGGVLPYQDCYITQELMEYMKGFDYRVGTLEAAIGTGLPYDSTKMAGRQNIIYARNEDFFRVKEMGFDVVSLANNHVWDLGEEGLKNTIRILKESGIQYCGAGMNLEEAAEPAVIEKNGLRIAVIACCMYGNKYLGYVELAGNNKAGVNPLDIEKVVADIKDAKQKYDKVIVLPHWGREYLFEPIPECIAMVKKMIKAGADAVLGSHTHQLQPLVHYRSKPVCYSMGNFLFPDFYMYPPRPIWYPNSLEEVKDVETFVGYPDHIDQPTRQVWNPVSRYGCVVGLSFEKEETTCDVKFVHISDDNVVSMSQLPFVILKQLKKSTLIVNNTLLRQLVFVRRNIRSLIRKIS